MGLFFAYEKSRFSHDMAHFITADLKRDLDSTKKKYNEASDKLSEKNRQHQKLQVG